MDIKKLKVSKTIDANSVATLLDQIGDDLIDIVDSVEALKVPSSTFYDGEEQKRNVLDNINRLLSTVCDLYNQMIE